MTRVPMVAWLLLLAVSACSNEARPVSAALPQTPPTGAGDPRIDQYQKNQYQISQGGRYFIWYGCARCHYGSRAAVARPR